MICTLYAIYPQDSINAPFVLRDMNQSKLSVMEMYKDLACKKCLKLNERSALKRGIRENIIIRSNRPFLVSLDNLYLLNARCKDVFTNIFTNEIDYYQIPSSTHFSVATAKSCLQPLQSDLGFRFSRDICKDCKRPREVVWGKIPPTISGLKQFQAINLESIQGAREIWLVSKDAAEELKKVKPPLSGIVLSPKEVDDGVLLNH